MLKIALFWKKFCYEVSLCENHQRRKAFTGLSIRAKMVYHFAGDVPYDVKIWPKLTHPLQKRRFLANIHS